MSQPNTPPVVSTIESVDDNHVIAERRQKLTTIRQQGIAFPNDWRRSDLAGDLQTRYAETDAEQLATLEQAVNIAGRIMAKRLFGKGGFAKLRDQSGDIQLYLSLDQLGELTLDAFKHWDIGDIVGAKGILTRTKTGELSVKVTTLTLITKSLRPLPDKFHGLTDTEARYRQRYVDLIMNPEVRDTFRKRSAIIQGIRQFLDQRGFLEVETPMMQAIPGGAVAKPFETYHNALDMPFYLRIAPELYLKRLVVGGFEKVFEINRNFRNEGVSARHNPEFTMLEFYWAYADYRDLMDFTEALMCELALTITGATKVSYQGEMLTFDGQFARMTVQESIAHYVDDIGDIETELGVKTLADRLGISYKPSDGWGKVLMSIFDEKVEANLRQPTFITGYPAEVSPLARLNDTNPNITDRFEFFVGGRELANGFSELNDPEDQEQRFHQQVAEKEAGDDEAMHFDRDYITALEYGLPPTAGEGIGIDRLVMLFTDAASIRDVLLFPHMRMRG